MRAVLLIGLTLLITFTVYGQRSGNLLPDYIKLQHAGSIGFMSIGAGYELLNKHVEAEILYGNVPARYGGPLDIGTLRLIYNPVNIRLSKTISMTPVTVSGFMSYHFGHQFFVLLPANYYEGYYKWSSAIRYHAGAGSSLTIQQKSGKHGISFYYELNTNDLYIKSLKANSSLSFTDILSLGAGIKIF